MLLNNELDHFLLVLMKRDDLKCPSAILFSFVFFFLLLDRTTMLKLQARITTKR